MRWFCCCWSIVKCTSHCLLSSFWYALLCVLPSFLNQLEEEEKAVVFVVFLLLLSYRCLVTVNVLWVGLQCVIVVFSDHTTLLLANLQYSIILILISIVLKVGLVLCH